MIAELVTYTSLAGLAYSIGRRILPPGLVIWAVLGNAPHLVYVAVGAMIVYWLHRILAFAWGYDAD